MVDVTGTKGFFQVLKLLLWWPSGVESLSYSTILSRQGLPFLETCPAQYSLNVGDLHLLKVINISDKVIPMNVKDGAEVALVEPFK